MGSVAREVQEAQPPTTARALVGAPEVAGAQVDVGAAGAGAGMSAGVGLRAMRPQQLIALQRSVGNAAVARMLAGSQHVAREPSNTFTSVLPSAEPAAGPPVGAASPEPERSGAAEPSEAVAAEAPAPVEPPIAAKVEGPIEAVAAEAPAPIEPPIAAKVEGPHKGSDEDVPAPEAQAEAPAKPGPPPPTAHGAATDAELPPELADPAVTPGPRMPELPSAVVARSPAPHATATQQVVAREEDKEDDDGGIVGSIRRRISGVVGGLKSGWSSLTGSVQSGVAFVQDRFASVTEVLGSLTDGVISRVQAAWASARETAGGLADGLKGALGGALSGIGGAVGAIKDALVNLDMGALSAAWDGLKGVLGGAWSGVQAGGAALRERLSGLWGGLQDGFTGAMGGLADRGREVIGGVRSAVSGVTGKMASMWEGLTSSASGLAPEGGGMLARAAHAVIERIVSAAKSVWGGIQGQWSALRERTGTWLSGVAERASGTWDSIKQRASGVWEGVQGAWASVKTRVTSAADSLTSGVGRLWSSISGFSFGGVISKLAEYLPAIKQIQAAADDPESIIDPYATAISDQLVATPAKAQGVIAEHAGGSDATGPGATGASATQPATAAPAAGAGPTLARKPSRAAARRIQREARDTASFGDIYDGLCEAVGAKWQQVSVKKIVMDMLITIVWPWPTVGREFVAMGKEWKETVNSFYAPRNLLDDPLGCLHDLYSNLLKVLDFPIVLWRHLMNIGMALMGWVTIFLMIAGAIGGTVGGTVIGAVAGALAGLGIGAVPGGGAGAAAGGAAGAGAGFAAAMGIGQALVMGYAAAEVTALLKALLDLKTGRQTPEEQVRAYNQVADSGIGLAILAILVPLGWIAGRLATWIATRLVRFVPVSIRGALADFGKGARDFKGDPDPAVADPTADAKKAYESIDPRGKAPDGYTFTDDPPVPDGDLMIYRTQVQAPGGSGWIERAYDPKTGTFEMRNAFLDQIPKDQRILNIDGKTIPLVDYLTLRQMRLAGVPFGGIVKVKMSTIQNIRTIAKVAAQEHSGVPPDQSITGTQSYSYGERSITASGQRVKSATVKGGTRSPFDDLLKHYETRGNPTAPRDPAIVAGHDKILSQEGVGRNDVVLWNFDIVLDVEPVSPSTPAPPAKPGSTVPPVIVGPPTPSDNSDREPVETK